MFEELTKQNGFEKGFEIGIMREKRKIAKSLMGLLDIAIIAEKTGLCIDEIKKLSKEN